MSSYFIIEKDSKAIKSIRDVFQESPDFNFIGSSASYDDAMNTVLKQTPGLLFMSIDDTIKNPFQFAQEIKYYGNESPLIIAISSSKKLAYEVIKMNFLDYLLKPLAELDIRKAMLNAKKQISSQSGSTVCLKSYKDYQYLNTEEILFLKADNNTTDFHMKDGTIISAYKTLKTYENLLPKNFLRIHKSYIINSDYVSRINYGKLICTIKRCSCNIPFTKTYIDNVESINQALSQSSLLSLN